MGAKIAANATVLTAVEGRIQHRSNKIQAQTLQLGTVQSVAPRRCFAVRELLDISRGRCVRDTGCAVRLSSGGPGRDLDDHIAGYRRLAGG